MARGEKSDPPVTPLSQDIAPLRRLIGPPINIPMFFEVCCSCRDGLAQPPKQPKKRVRTSGDPKTEGSPIASPIQSQKPKKATNRPDATIQTLERFYERANVSLKLPEGGRLKPESTNELKRKQRPSINFTAELTQLREGKPAASYAIIDLMDDDDDLPEPHELRTPTKFVAKKRDPSPETNYSDSEIDSLIRHAPSELMQEDFVEETAMWPKPPKLNLTKAVRERLPPTPLPSWKCRPSAEEDLPQPKRTRFEVGARQRFSASPADRPKVETPSFAAMILVTLYRW